MAVAEADMAARTEFRFMPANGVAYCEACVGVARRAAWVLARPDLGVFGPNWSLCDEHAREIVRDLPEALRGEIRREEPVESPPEAASRCEEAAREEAVDSAPKTWLTPEQVERQLGVPVGTLNSWVAKGLLGYQIDPHLKCRTYDPDEVLALKRKVEEKRRGGRR